MTDNSRDERLQIMLSEAELEAVDTWRFQRCMPSRASAVRELLRRGLSARGFLTTTGRTKSKEFGVVERQTPPSPSDEVAGVGPGNRPFPRPGLSPHRRPDRVLRALA